MTTTQNPVPPYALVPGDRVRVADDDVRTVAKVEAVPPRLFHTARQSTILFDDGTKLKVPGPAKVEVVQ